MESLSRSSALGPSRDWCALETTNVSNMSNENRSWGASATPSSVKIPMSSEANLPSWRGTAILPFA